MLNWLIVGYFPTVVSLSDFKVFFQSKTFLFFSCYCFFENLFFWVFSVMFFSVISKFLFFVLGFFRPRAFCFKNYTKQTQLKVLLQIHKKTYEIYFTAKRTSRWYGSNIIQAFSHVTTDYNIYQSYGKIRYKNVFF